MTIGCEDQEQSRILVVQLGTCCPQSLVSSESGHLWQNKSKVASSRRSSNERISRSKTGLELTYIVRLDKLTIPIFFRPASSGWPKNVFINRAARCIQTLTKNAFIIQAHQSFTKARKVISTMISPKFQIPEDAEDADLSL